MKNTIIQLLAVLVLFPSFLMAQDLSQQELKEKFDDPGPAWRGKPFWSWNGELEKDELIRQVHVMKEMGMGGFFMHSRTGLKTEYLGDKWFDLINACADEAEDLGMEAWLYDEDRWPSGTAGGMVTQNPEYRAKLMTMHVFEPGRFKAEQEYKVLFSCRLDSTDCYDARRLTVKEARKANKELWILGFFVRNVESSSFYNGNTDVDRMSREATDYFIKITHEAYSERCGDRIGTSIKGIFTDEPHRQRALRDAVSLDESFSNLIYLPWTTKFPEEFESRMGYSILDNLPALFLNPEGAELAKVKWDYVEVTQQLFLDNWVKPVSDWCEQNNMKFTGHFLHENSLTAQTLMQGSLMRSYEFMQVPGIDVLTHLWNFPWIAKQCQSVTRQIGQKFMLSELYAATGWEFDFTGHKYVGDWQALFGVNLRCHHLSWYTMEGQAKRDYPASILHQSTWYKEYEYVETYFARLGFMLSQGQPDCEVLVLNPVESVWSRLRLGWTNGWSPNADDIKELEESYTELFWALQENQIDFDYGDEDILQRHASVKRGTSHKPVLQVGEAAYSTVVIGKMTTLRESTLELLKAFGEAGGTIIMAGDAPTYLNAEPSGRPAAVLASAIQIPFERDLIAAAVRENTAIPIEVIDPTTETPMKDILCQVRRDGERTIVVAMNFNTEKSFDQALIRLNAIGEVTEWDCETGRIVGINASQKGEVLEIPVSFYGPEEHVFAISHEAIPGAVSLTTTQKLGEIEFTGPMAYHLNEPNLCVLDMGYLEMEGEKGEEVLEILKIDEKLREYYKLPFRGGKMVQPWFTKKFHSKPPILGQARIHYPFFIGELPEEDLVICMETPAEFRILVNGKNLEKEEEGWWVDQAIRTFILPKELLKEGENMLVQDFNFREDLDLEAMYILGDFSVQLEGHRKILGKLPERIGFGDLSQQGFPFYTGKIQYILDLREDYSRAGKVVLEVPEYSAACIIVNPGKEKGGTIAWKPNKLEVSDAVQSGDHLVLEAVLTRRNAFGPLHRTPFEKVSSPVSFLSTGDNWTNNYVLHPGGILNSPKLVLYK